MIENPKRVEWLLSQLAFQAEVLASNASHHLKMKNSKKVVGDYLDISVLIQALQEEEYIGAELDSLDERIIALEKRTPKKFRRKK